METILRTAAIYVGLLLIFRVSGKRTLGQSTPFDLLLLLIISETVQQAMVGTDHSLVNALLLIVTVVGIDRALAWIKDRSVLADKLLEGTPLILVQDGHVFDERLRKSRVDEQDILEAARRLRGLERMEQVRWAVLERNGEITVVGE